MFNSFFDRDDKIEFACKDEYWEVIPQPYSAKKYIPDWYKALPMSLNEKDGCNDHFQNGTIKKCIPFLDAMTTGYIIPLAADVEFTTNENANEVNWKCKLPKQMIESHSKSQITTDKCPNSMAKYFPLKFINLWYIKTPPGWSTLFVPPLNRSDDRFVCYSGLVDTDKYTNYIHFPFFFTKPNFVGILKQGTPLVQAIPIQRKYLKSNVRKVKNEEEKKIEKINKTLEFQRSYYRDYLVEKK